VFTARNDIANLARREGANDFIAKPFKPEDLLKKIEDLLPEAA
jgi:FixJ family two-component response regulator